VSGNSTTSGTARPLRTTSARESTLRHRSANLETTGLD
jgi:hypothetical protein